ncbi:uncharacterized protein BJ212DRAFT_1326256 [Suillus subaureus]|uniref:Uncharacterized protein n=1 Tax=Suillus subaureus TaxID=48587 RepID=A0A9P7EJJ2_9AGAM|nr:uncharacterized protein BJ212DRAFT_1326256 [Suillus subaureus]KAG1823719.1 hypothetical protein BJ212DRAFT_1326256 [Suillus subaureus]
MPPRPMYLAKPAPPSTHTQVLVVPGGMLTRAQAFQSRPSTAPCNYSPYFKLHSCAFLSPALRPAPSIAARTRFLPCAASHPSSRTVIPPIPTNNLQHSPMPDCRSPHPRRIIQFDPAYLGAGPGNNHNVLR